MKPTCAQLILISEALGMDSGRIREKIRQNATEIVRLHSRVHETVRHRQESPKKRLEWEKACAEFHRCIPNSLSPEATSVRLAHHGR
jgi:hypothetical protein